MSVAKDFDGASHRELVFDAIYRERDNQDKKWGEQNHGDLYWLGIAAEEFGELAQAIIQDQLYEDVEKELLHLAAVCVAWAECHLRHTGPAVGLLGCQVGGKASE